MSTRLSRPPLVSMSVSVSLFAQNVIMRVEYATAAGGIHLDHGDLVLSVTHALGTS
eukprot:COSAG06_NODE_39539_length_411_cov_1.147436_2_plen_55_part_01